MLPRDSHNYSVRSAFFPPAPAPGKVDGKKKVVSRQQRAHGANPGLFSAFCSSKTTHRWYQALRLKTSLSSCQDDLSTYWQENICMRRDRSPRESLALRSVAAGFMQSASLRVLWRAIRHLNRLSLCLMTISTLLISVCPTFRPRLCVCVWGRGRDGLPYWCSFLSSMYDSIIHLHKQSDWITLHAEEQLAESRIIIAETMHN